MNENKNDEFASLQLEGRRAVQEALNRGRQIDKILIRKGEIEGTLKIIVAKAREQGVVVQQVDKNRLDTVAHNERHQGIIALCPAHDYADPEEFLSAAAEKGEDPFVLILDGITDTHNLGAMIRSAEACGVHGVVIHKRRAASLTGVVSKAAAGALAYMPVARVTNIAETIESFKKRGLWIACADMKGKPIYKADLKGPLALVIGEEGQGVSRLVQSKCDFAVSIPMYGQIPSLNASVAAGILMYEVARRRRAAE